MIQIVRLAALAIGLTGLSSAQTPAAIPDGPVTTLGGILKILVLEGNNAVNSVSTGRSVTPVVEVRDANDFPVEGATVVFSLPETGPGGTFAGNQRTLSTRTTAQGQAGAPFLLNGLVGKFAIRVEATYQGRKGEATIPQTNSNGAYVGPAIPPTPWYKRKLTWILIAGAAGGGIAAWRLNSGSTPPPPAPNPTLVITPGGPVFGR